MWMVAMKFKPVRMELKPRMNAPISAISTAEPGEAYVEE